MPLPAYCIMCYKVDMMLQPPSGLMSIRCSLWVVVHVWQPHIFPLPRPYIITHTRTLQKNCCQESISYTWNKNIVKSISKFQITTTLYPSSLSIGLKVMKLFLTVRPIEHVLNSTPLLSLLTNNIFNIQESVAGIANKK